MALEYHELREHLPAEVIEQHRAVASLIEEMEAVIWYQQRAAVSANDELAAVLRHNRDEEIEHASMLLEWLRLNFPGFDEKMRSYLFHHKPILQLEDEAEHGTTEESNHNPPTQLHDGTLGIGAMKGPVT